jgi:hypothetical protein
VLSWRVSFYMQIPVERLNGNHFSIESSEIR